MRRPKRRLQRPPEPPGNALEGAPWVRHYLIDLYDSRDGEAANWQLIAETAFKVAFDAADAAPPSDRRAAMLQRLHAAAYDRIAEPSAGQSDEKSLDLRSIVSFERMPNATQPAVSKGQRFD